MMYLLLLIKRCVLDYSQKTAMSSFRLFKFQSIEVAVPKLSSNLSVHFILLDRNSFVHMAKMTLTGALVHQKIPGFCILGFYVVDFGKGKPLPCDKGWPVPCGSKIPILSILSANMCNLYIDYGYGKHFIDVITG